LATGHQQITEEFNLSQTNGFSEKFLPFVANSVSNEKTCCCANTPKVKAPIDKFPNKSRSRQLAYAHVLGLDSSVSSYGQ
jgi:hypothetical protein